jgi:hypothetical protein
MILNISIFEDMDTDVKVVAVDPNPIDEVLNARPNEVMNLRDTVNMGTKGMNVDKSHNSGALTPSQAPALVVRSLNSRIDISSY